MGDPVVTEDLNDQGQESLIGSRSPEALEAPLICGRSRRSGRSEVWEV